MQFLEQFDSNDALEFYTRLIPETYVVSIYSNYKQAFLDNIFYAYKNDCLNEFANTLIEENSELIEDLILNGINEKDLSQEQQRNLQMIYEDLVFPVVKQIEEELPFDEIVNLGEFSDFEIKGIKKIITNLYKELR